jgi:hypothetical protein
MSAPIDELVNIECVDLDGDRMVCPFELNFWEIVDKIRRIFDVELSFRYCRCDYSAKTDEKIYFFIPRDSRHVAQIETCLVRALGPLCQELAESMHVKDGWRPEVIAKIFRYSGIRGARAFLDAKWAVIRAGEELDHPDPERLERMGLEEGLRAAKLANSRRDGQYRQ